jgi:hypothetical protein
MPGEEEPVFQYTIVFRRKSWNPVAVERLIGALNKGFSILHTDIRSHTTDPRTGEKKLHTRPEIAILSYQPGIFDDVEPLREIDNAIAEIKTTVLPRIPEGITPKRFREQGGKAGFDRVRLETPFPRQSNRQEHPAAH